MYQKFVLCLLAAGPGLVAAEMADKIDEFQNQIVALIDPLIDPSDDKLLGDVKLEVRAIQGGRATVR